jgi:hypothetical protein
MASNDINWPIGATAKLNAIANIRKYKMFQKRHHFIPMVMEVHDTPERDMDRFIKECAHLFHDRQSKDHLSFFFAFNFSSNVLVLFSNVL